MTPLRIQKTSAFKDEQQHNSLHNATAESLHPHPSAFYHSFQGKKGALERLETETMNQGGKKCTIMPTKQFLQSAVHHWGQQPAHQTQAQPCPVECAASHISLHPCALQNTSSRHFCSQLYCLSELLSKQRQPLQQGQSSSAPQSCTVTCQAVAVCSEQMDFPVVCNTSGNRILV